MGVLDDFIFEQENQSVPGPIEDELMREPYVGAWRYYDKEKKLPFATLKDLEGVADKVEWEKGYASNVVSRLYYFNSRVKVYQNDEGNQLLVLPDAKVVIDLFNYTSDFFLGNNKEVSIDKCVMDILRFIGCEGYHFYFLRDAYNTINQISLIPRFPERTIKKGEVLFQGTSFLNSNASEAFLNFVFHGNYNWASNSKGNLEYSLYPNPVICYETLAYIKVEKDYCIDLKTSIDNIQLDDYLDNRQIVLLSRFSPNNPDAEGWTGETAIKFLGMYKLDRQRSRDEKHLVYKFAEATYKLF